MSTTVNIGKIQKLRIGHGGRDDVMLGLDIVLGGQGWGVSTFKGTWSPALMGTVPAHAKWSEDDRSKTIDETFRWLDELLMDAKCKDAFDLIGKPVEATFENGVLQHWRILTEVL